MELRKFCRGAERSSGGKGPRFSPPGRGPTTGHPGFESRAFEFRVSCRGS